MSKEIEYIKNNVNIKETKKANSRRYYFTIENQDIVKSGKYIWDDLNARLCTIIAVDQKDQIELLYPFELPLSKIIVTLKTFVSKPELKIDSLAPVIKGAEYIEREIYELFGVMFKGHPGLENLLLSYEGKKDETPLRRDV